MIEAQRAVSTDVTDDPFVRMFLPDGGVDVQSVKSKPRKAAKVKPVMLVTRPHDDPDVPVIGEVRTIVKSAPRMALVNTHADGTTDLYPSEAVLQVEWSDGTVDYACRFDGCDYRSAKHRTVSAHYGGAHNRGKGVQPQPAPVEFAAPRSSALWVRRRWLTSTSAATAYAWQVCHET